MSVGVIASCMVCLEQLARPEADINWDLQPSMSSLLHHLPSWDGLSTKWTSRFSSNREKVSGSNSSLNRKRADYKDLENSNVAIKERNYEMAPVKSLSNYIHTGNPVDVRTYVHTGGRSDVEEDGIYLQYNVEQESNMSERGIEDVSRV